MMMVVMGSALRFPLLLLLALAGPAATLAGYIEVSRGRAAAAGGACERAWRAPRPLPFSSGGPAPSGLSPGAAGTRGGPAARGRGRALSGGGWRRGRGGTFSPA